MQLAIDLSYSYILKNAVKIMNYAFNFYVCTFMHITIRMYILSFIDMTHSYVDVEGVMYTPVQYVIKIV